MEFSLPTSRGLGDDDPNDDVLNQVRVVIFSATSSGSEVGAPYLNEVYYSPTPNAREIVITEIVPVGYLNIYLIGNETEDPTLNLVGTPLDNITSSAQLTSKMLDYTPADGNYVEPPFVMYSVFNSVQVTALGEIMHPNVVVDPGPPTKYIFPIERTVAKLTVKLDCNFSDLGGNKIWIDEARIVSMPLQPGLAPKEYAIGGAFFSSDRLDLSPYMRYKIPTDPGYDPSSPLGAEQGIITNSGFTFYLPEHIVNNSDRSHYTYLELVGHLSYGTGATITYTVPLGNGLGVGINTPAYLRTNFATVPAADLAVIRNTYTTLTLYIMGLGERSDIDVVVAIKPWDWEDIPVDPNVPFLHVSTVSTSVYGDEVRRIYFWTNQLDGPIFLDPLGKITTSSGTNFNVNYVYVDVAGTTSPVNFAFDPVTGLGYFDLMINPGYSPPNSDPTRYLIYLKAGKLSREIEVLTIINPCEANSYFEDLSRFTEFKVKVALDGNENPIGSSSPTHTQSMRFLTYNLGAKPNLTPKEQMAYPGAFRDITVYGGWYQWGRQDNRHTFRCAYPTSDETKFRSTKIDYATLPGGDDGRFVVDVYDWLTPSTDNLWGNGLLAANGGNEGGAKGNYDPCPAGYRVPTQHEWALLGYENGSITDFVNDRFNTSGAVTPTQSGLVWVRVSNGLPDNTSGSLWPNVGTNMNGFVLYDYEEWYNSGKPTSNLTAAGAPEPLMFLPHSGIREQGTGLGESVSYMYWTSTIDDKTAFTYTSRNLTLWHESVEGDNSIAGADRVNGLPVRCIQETLPPPEQMPSEASSTDYCIGGQNRLDVKNNSYNDERRPLTVRNLSTGDFPDAKIYTFYDLKGAGLYTDLWFEITDDPNGLVLSYTVTLPSVSVNFNSNIKSIVGNGSMSCKLVARFKVGGVQYYKTLPITVRDGTSGISLTDFAGNWITFMNANMGAHPCANCWTVDEQVAYLSSGSTDATIYGGTFQWGRLTDGHQMRNSATLSGATSPTPTPGHNMFITSSGGSWYSGANAGLLWNQGATGAPVKSANDPCPGGWRVPTELELTALSSNTVQWNASSGTGLLLRPSFASSWTLFLPASGARAFSNGLYNSVGTYGYYWSSGYSGNNAQYIAFSSSGSIDSGATYIGTGYSLRCVADAPSLSVSPPNLIFLPTATGLGSGQTVTVSTNLPSWSSSVNNGIFTVAQTGSNTLTVYPNSPNTTTTSRTATITVTAGGLTQNVTVTQLEDASTAPANVVPYVGAFWTAQEKGERILRFVGLGAGSANWGPWSATVLSYGVGWNPGSGDGIVFSTSRLDAGTLASRGISFTSNMTPMDAESSASLVTDGTSSVSGVVDDGANQDVLFRIGLQKPFSAFDAEHNPARYAVVALVYGTPAKLYKIYIRQGEGADYVMNIGDKNSSGTTVDDNRAYARKLMPYNLTAQEYKDGTKAGGSNLSDHVQIPLRTGSSGGGAFVKYPTQAGALFQFTANAPNQRWAYHPVNPLTGLISGYPAGSGTLWDETNNETCPPGYRRPQDGSPTAQNATGPVAGSEIRQSLWLNPPSNQNSNNNNCAAGFYADGFFDRRQIVAGQGLLSGANSVVSIANGNMASRGLLFYNPVSFASLFFPASGIYSNLPSNGRAYMGQESYISTSSTQNGSYAWKLMVALVNTAGSSVRMNPIAHSSIASTVRCIKMQDNEKSSAPLLYMAADGSLQIGRWGIEIDQSSLLYFKFGSVMGLRIYNPSGNHTYPDNTAWASSGGASAVWYNVTGGTYAQYDNIPYYNVTPDYHTHNILNISNSAYHNGTNVKSGKGDPCKLIGLTPAQIQSMSPSAIDAYSSGYRMPTKQENVDFVNARTLEYGYNPALMPWSGMNPNYTLMNQGTTNGTYSFWGPPPGGTGLYGGGWYPIPGDRESTANRRPRSTNPDGFLPAAGYRGGAGDPNDGGPGGLTNNGQVRYMTTHGFYWSSDFCLYNGRGYGYSIGFDSPDFWAPGHTYPAIHNRTLYAFPVRCVRE